MTIRPFEILFVCYGNISRSPSAEYLMRAALNDSFLVSSAGVGAYRIVGHRIDPKMTPLLAAHNIDASSHAARQLDCHLIAQADLILAMEEDHRSWIAEEDPHATKRSFTLREFARLVQAISDPKPKSVAALVHQAATNRAIHPAASSSENNIEDPYGGTQQGYRIVFSQIDAAVKVIAAELLQYQELRSDIDADPWTSFVL